jgi:pentatricopeptide repeat protein
MQCSVPDELALANFFLAFQSASGLPCKADSFNVTLKCCIHSMDLEAARDILHDMEEMGVAANRATFATLLRALKEYPEMPIDEINWMLERAVVLGGRPSPEMIIDVIERCEDVRQSAFFLDICLRNRLLPPSKVLRMAEKIQERLAWERFDTNKLRQEAVAFFKKLVSEARAVVVGRLKTFRKPASADARFEHRPQNSG